MAWLFGKEQRTFIVFLKKLDKETNTNGMNFPIEEAQSGKKCIFAMSPST